MTIAIAIVLGLASLVLIAWSLVRIHRARRFWLRVDRAVAHRPAAYAPCLSEAEIAQLNAARWE